MTKPIMKFIEKEKKRNLCYRQRKGALIKKAREFSILCDVPICVIIYPFNDNPEVFCYKNEIGDQKPRLTSNLDNGDNNNLKLASEIIGRYLAYPKKDAKKRSLNLRDVLKDHDKGKLIRAEKTNLSDFSVEQLMELLGNLDYKIDCVTRKIDAIKGSNVGQQKSQVFDDDGLFPPSEYDFGKEYADLMETTIDDDGNVGVYNMNQKMGFTGFVDQGSEFVGNYHLQCHPMMMNPGYYDQGLGFTGSYPLQCGPMMGSSIHGYANQGPGLAYNYPLHCFPNAMSPTYSDNQGSGLADVLPLQCCPVYYDQMTGFFV